jgi:small subunit ribosomal protein S16
MYVPLRPRKARRYFNVRNRARNFLILINFSVFNMAVKIRLQRKGRTKAPFYHIVIANSRSPRDGRFIEKIGTYNPLTIPATIDLNNQKAYEWLKNGAQPTDTVRAILRFKGVLYQKHLDRGVKKGALTPEQAEAQLAKWIEEKEGRVSARRQATAEQKRQFTVAVDGKPKVKAKPVVEAPVVEEVAPEAEEVVETVEAVVAAAPETVAEAAEVVAEPVVAAAEEVAEVVAEPVVAAVEEAAEVVAEPVVAAAEEVSEAAAEATEAPAE